MTTKMTRAEAETFLAGVHVGVLSIDEPDRGPLSVPVWYDYEAGGEIWFVTERESRKGKLMEDGQRVSFCVQNEALPYQYVSVEGPICSIETANVEEHMRPLAHRYMGAKDGDHYVEVNEYGEGEMIESIVVRVMPERWLTADYGKEEVGL
jgi:nitroimidazol reductase NimA-like FMN-containing flavoprotein (pyridoxamine 5'-phosphate oxidase superfamily)